MLVAVLLSLVVGVSPELDDGRALYAGLKYRAALERLEPFAHSPTAPLDERVEALELVARCQLALNQPAKAVAAFEQLLSLSPAAPEPSGAPKVRQAFLEAKQKKFPANYVLLKRRATAADVLELELFNPWGVPVTLELSLTVGNEPAVVRVLEVTGGRALAALPAGSTAYVMAKGADGRVLSSLGSAEAPLAGPAATRTEVAPAQPPPAQPPMNAAAGAPLAAPAATLTPQQPTATPADLNVKNGPATSSIRRPLGWSVAAVGVLLALSGIIPVLMSAEDARLSAGYPFTVRTLAEVSALDASAQSKRIAAYALFGSGGLVALTGLIIALTAPSTP